MNINELTIGQLKEVAKLASGLGACDGSVAENSDGRVVIVRSRDQGVMFGNLQGVEGASVSLTNAVQMWRWKAAKGGTLVDCATFGVDASKCKFSEGGTATTILNACAILDCTEDGAKSLAAVQGGDWS